MYNAFDSTTLRPIHLFTADEVQLAVDKEGNAYLGGDFQRTIIGFGDQVNGMLVAV